MGKTAFALPEDRTTIIWRYMTFAKFVYMLQTRSLFFCTAEKLSEDDPWEGTFACGSDTGICEARRQIGLSCWYLGDHESMAMWTAYGGDSSSVAIQSTVDGLINSFCNKEDAQYAGCVEYRPETDWRQQDFYEDDLSRFFVKRQGYSHERELRVLIRIHPALFALEKDGRSIPCDLATLIHKVKVSPKAEPWFFNTVVATLIASKLADVQVEGSMHAKYVRPLCIPK
jgi:hypothetical protein